jgi:hypothetical protein
LHITSLTGFCLWLQQEEVERWRNAAANVVEEITGLKARMKDVCVPTLTSIVLVDDLSCTVAAIV